MATLDQVGDQRHDGVDVLGRQRLVVGAADPQALGVGEIVRGHRAGQLVRGHASAPRSVVDLVVDVGDVGDELHPVALVLEEALELGEDDVRARVADVHARVDRRPAGVDADLAGVAGLQRPHLAGARVVEADFSHGAVRLLPPGAFRAPGR